MQSIITTNNQTRKLTLAVVQNLSHDQWFTIPTGFDNNIAWNVGHIITVQQSLIYRLSGLQTHTSKPFAKLFNPGTSPADWATNPDPAELQALLLSTSEAWQADY
ncbi:MAG: DinB family protein, partial [Sphaerospermopsis sp. SIO1G2]|nr:DinB family protein [Sphaerospermopsis sp. SIO1G2]